MLFGSTFACEHDVAPDHPAISTADAKEYCSHLATAGYDATTAQRATTSTSSLNLHFFSRSVSPPSEPQCIHPAAFIIVAITIASWLHWH